MSFLRYGAFGVIKSLLCCSIVVVIYVSFLPSEKVFSSAQYVALGSCPRTYGMPDFDISRYEGRWYEVEKFWFIGEVTASCVSVEYFDKNDGTFAVEIDHIDNLTGKRQKNPGTTKYISRDGSANFVLDLLMTQSPVPFLMRYPYLVLDTDYTSYTIKYLCQRAGPFNAQTLWILSRNRTLTHEAREKAYHTLKLFGLDTTRLLKSDQSSCPPT